jgi:hypothetical protein
MMTHREYALICAALCLATAIAGIAVIRYAHGDHKQLCQIQPGREGWHYRTKVDGKSWRCYYQGERMKPRDQLYWAETPMAPSIIEHLPWQLEPRWHGEDNQ